MRKRAHNRRLLRQVGVVLCGPMAIRITPASPVSAIVREADEFHRALLERAYEQGFKSGFAEAQRRILEAASITTTVTVAKSVAKPARLGRKPRAHPNSSDARRFPYGAIANAFRSALLNRSGAGITTDEMIRAAAADLGIPAANIKHRDTIKRLREKNEMVTRNGLHFPGPALTAASQNGNGAAKAAPDADEVDASSNRPELDLAVFNR